MASGTAAASADNFPSFLTGLRDAGLLVRERYSEHTPGEITGYAVALPTDRDTTGARVWYSGAKLAADLSLPRLQARWAGHSSPAATGERSR